MHSVAIKLRQPAKNVNSQSDVAQGIRLAGNLKAEHLLVLKHIMRSTHDGKAPSDEDESNNFLNIEEGDPKQIDVDIHVVESLHERILW